MNYLNAFPNYYEILQVPVDASTSEIKKAFRQRAKEIHPDTSSDSGKTVSAMRDLLTAYETLIHDDLRQEYDLRYHRVFPREEFDYREFLRSRYDDPESAGKLIFFDLLHDHEEEALDLYHTLTREKGFNLYDHLDREDFMDCAFLLAEKYEEAGNFAASFNLLKTLVDYELKRPYFRHFFQEILDKLRNLLLHKINVPITQHIDYLLQVIKTPLQEKERAIYMKKVSELYAMYNDDRRAEFFIAEARRLNPRIQGTRKTGMASFPTSSTKGYRL